MGTPIPAPSTEIVQKDRSDVIHPFSYLYTVSQREVVLLTKGNGCTVTDSAGREFLDAGAGLWCVNIGYGRSEIADVASRQIERLSYGHSFGAFSNEPMVRLASRILSLAPPTMRRVLFTNSGSEANDTQIKLVRRYNNVLQRPKKKKVIARKSAYHGTTLGSGSLTSLETVHRTFDLPIDGISHTLAADWHRRPGHITDPQQYSRYLADELERHIQREGPDTVAAFIAEPITGSSGILMPPAGYFAEIRRVLDKYDVLMVADEVITGFGRTGSWFASPSLELKPDLMTIGKGITSGYFPLAACLVSEKVCEVLYSEKEYDGFFGHGLTFGGHPLGCAIALANIDIMERESLPAHSAEIGAYLDSQLRERLAEKDFVSDIRGRGLQIAIELDENTATRRPFADVSRAAELLSTACFCAGIIVRGAPGRVAALIAPPLTITKSDADQIVDRLASALDYFEDNWPGTSTA